jgi:Na+-transporting methylmalonyl-CoA/oxaloacetate decarboxylase gamma subunit
MLTVAAIFNFLGLLSIFIFIFILFYFIWAVTRVRPGPFQSPVMIDQFYSTQDLIQTLATSCYIPFYSAPTLTRSSRQTKP